MVEVLEYDFGSPEAREKVLDVAKKFFEKLSSDDKRLYGKHWKKMMEGQDGKNVPADAAFDLFRRSGLPLDTLEFIWDVSCQNVESCLNQTEFLFALRMISASQSGIKLPITCAHLLKSSLKVPQFDRTPAEDTRGESDDTHTEPPVAPKKPSSLSRRGSKLDMPSRTSTKTRSKRSKRSGKQRTSSRRSANTPTGSGGSEGLADAETASISSQPGAASSAGGDTGSEGGDLESKNALSKRAMSMPMKQSKDRKPTLSSSTSVPPSASDGSENGDASPPEDESDWIMKDRIRSKYAKLFPQADKDGDGFVGPLEAREYFSQSKLSKSVLREVWFLADTHRDGKGLRKNEFIVAMHVMMKAKHEKLTLPKKLPQCLADIIEEETSDDEN